MAYTIDQRKLKEELTRLAEQDLVAFKLLITEVVEAAKEDLAKVKTESSETKEKLDRAQIDALIDADFARFDDVFRALA